MNYFIISHQNNFRPFFILLFFLYLSQKGFNSPFNVAIRLRLRYTMWEIVHPGQSWIVDFLGCGFRITGTVFQSLSVKLGLWFSIVSRIPDSLSCILDSKAQDSGFRIPKAKISRIPVSGFPYKGRSKTLDPSMKYFKVFRNCLL